MLTTFLKDIPDFRRRQGQMYELEHILCFSILAILCGAKSYRNIGSFIEIHFKSLKEHFFLRWKKPPGYTTIRNIIKGVDSSAMEAAFRKFSLHLSTLSEQPGARLIAMDGKVIRKSFDNFNDKKAAQILSFFDAQEHFILGHVLINDKSNEIPSAQALLKSLTIENAVYTLDALHLTTGTFEAAALNNQGVLIQLKENQKNLLEDVECLTNNNTPAQTHEPPAECGHGRIEKRTTKVYSDVNIIKNEILNEDWETKIITIAKVERKTERFDAVSKTYIPSEETAYFLANVALTAEQAHKSIRFHWGIENRNHYVRDVALQEDNSRIRINPFNIAVLRSFALNIFRANNIENISQELYCNSLNWQRIYSYPQAV
ncbi:MAG: ISAs1 family transposase, partial [Segetibacter sp.]